MSIGIFITARLGSTRLAQKHLREVLGKPIMSYLLIRIKNEFKKETDNAQAVVSIVTGNRENNEKLLTSFPGMNVFFGDDDNIPKRHLEAARHYQVDAIVSVDGDDILCSPEAMRSVYELLQKQAPLVKTEGLPLGLNAWGYTTAFLEQSLAQADYKVLETGWGRIFDNSKMISIKKNHDTGELLRFTLDYEEDFLFFRKIISSENFTIDINDRDLIELVNKKQIFLENERIAKEYYINFNKNIALEEKKKTENK
ncbi:MAG: hypothetical protein A2096_12010 [Spirochaetes bacterium GWF1_41_5]|nr:MAG: hypothetical protein A2096_12010 [Spirochaetes bacterium GWF1_41_5]HBE01838.1 hypothetical protein [Spirochaetia bacterium]